MGKEWCVAGKTHISSQHHSYHAVKKPCVAELHTRLGGRCGNRPVVPPRKSLECNCGDHLRKGYILQASVEDTIPSFHTNRSIRDSPVTTLSSQQEQLLIVPRGVLVGIDPPPPPPPVVAPIPGSRAITSRNLAFGPHDVLWARWPQNFTNLQKATASCEYI